jgi:predicted acyl esterase
MNETIKIPATGEELEIETRPLTFVIPGANMPYRTEYPNRLRIDQQAAVYHMERVQWLHRFTSPWAVHVFGDVAKTKGANAVRKMGYCGLYHFVGMFDLAVKLIEKGVPIVLDHPETSLHPSCQADMADVLVDLMNFQRTGSSRICEEGRKMKESKE